MSKVQPAAGDLFQALVEYSSDAIVLADADGTMTFLSHTAERLLGYPISERPGGRSRGHELPRYHRTPARGRRAAPVGVEIPLLHRARGVRDLRVDRRRP